VTRLRAAAARLERALAPGGPVQRGRLFLLVLAGYAVFAVTYAPINHWSIGRPAHALYLPGEERVPFLPAFESLYVLTYVLPWVLVAVRPDFRVCARACLSFVLVLVVAYASYALFPVYLERPTLHVDSVATWLLALEYRDPSYNHFPSLHVALSWIVYLVTRGAAPRLGRVLLPVVLGISISTLFVKQHYVVDVVYGTLLAAVAWSLAARLLAPRVESRHAHGACAAAGAATLREASSS